MIFTFISTPSHGYLKVPINFLLASGFDKNKISQFSGLSKRFVFLEEDCDATKFINFLNEENGMEVEIKEKHQQRATSHNYNAELI